MGNWRLVFYLLKYWVCRSRLRNWMLISSVVDYNASRMAIFEPKIVENIDFTVRKRHQLDFWPKNHWKHRFCGSKKVSTRFLAQKSSKTSILRFERGTKTICDPENSNFFVWKKNARIFCKINISIDFMIAKFRKFWTKNRKNGQNKIHPKSRAPRSPLRLHLKNNLRQTMPPKKHPLPTQLLPHDRPQ